MEFGDILEGIMSEVIIDEELMEDILLKLNEKVMNLCGELLVLEGIETAEISPMHGTAIESAERKLAEVLTVWLQCRMVEYEE